MYGPELMNMIQNKEELHGNLEGLRGTVQLTNLIIKGKDMELLLLQKEVQEKLQGFGKTVPNELPRTATKVIHFVPGMLDMGYIHDSDRPILSQTRRTISHPSFEQDEYFDPADYFETVETQTLVSLLNPIDVATNTTPVTTSEVSQQTESSAANSDHWDGVNGIQNGENEDEDSAAARRRRRRRERERVAKSLETEEQVERQTRRTQRSNTIYQED